ncbi:MAG: hypothetical protein WCT36_00845 [Candidatus Gracilibacteria bacterium]|jgi:hypothetical protein|nr:MAG: hypothetical protein US89_C0003G0031 [Candidatus Peregrinibacteria bacterium GW2011_GWF2_38_29]HBB02913.1 hypothetical protein [Candidatus Peregrinibacteria bacterium]
MLKHLFTSETRVKLLTLFLLHPEDEYFIRELTRKLGEQINSIRRELDNLKKIGLLKSKTKNRKKYYVVDKNFLIFDELKGIILKSMSDNDTITKKIAKCGEIDLVVLSGMFIEKVSSIDLLIVGNIDKEKLGEVLNNEVGTKRPVKFSILTKDDFLYRLKCKDKFITDILADKTNIIAINNLQVSV